MTDTTPIQTSETYNATITSIGGDVVVMGHPQSKTMDYQRLREEAQHLVDTNDLTITYENAPHLAEFALKVLTLLSEAYVNEVWKFDASKLGLCKASPKVVEWKPTAKGELHTKHYHLCVLCCLDDNTWMDAEAAPDGPEAQGGEIFFYHPRAEEASHIPEVVVGDYYSPQAIRPNQGMVWVYPPYMKPNMIRTPERKPLYVVVGIQLMVNKESGE